MGFNKQKLKTNLRLAINRLKLLEKKKTELAQKARKEIADYLSNGKDERARIRVEHIIREDYLVEAMELLELYSDLLLARFGLIESMAYCDDGMAEAVTSLIWAAPRLQTDVAELKVIQEQLGYKYGKKFAHDASTNENGTVNPRLIHKLSPQCPPKMLVERYLIEIARSHNVPFEPDPTVMECGDDLPDIDDMKPPGGGSGGGGQIGFENFRGMNPGLSNIPDIPAFAGPGRPDSMPINNPSYAYPPPGQGAPPGGYPPAPANMYPPSDSQAPPAPTKGYNGPPSYPGAPTGPSSRGGPLPPTAPAPSAPSLPDLPELPSVPTNSLPSNNIGGTSAGGDDVDFDDLARRFEELKKKK